MVAEKRVKSSRSKSSTDHRVDAALVQKAVTALLRHHEQATSAKNSEEKRADLLGTETIVQVQFGLEVAPVRAHPKPIRLEIPHSFRAAVGDDEENQAYDAAEEPEVCVIVKEESKPWVQDMIREFPKHLSCVKKVLGLDSLRKKHSQYNQRRELLHKYTLFMADDRILPMLTTALGRDFFKAKKQPIPIRLTRKEAFPFTVQKALRSTHMTLSTGTCVTITVGKTDMPAKSLVDNIMAVTTGTKKNGDGGAVERLPRQWANVRSIAIKTPDSMALPIYNKTPEQLMEIAKLAGLPSVFQKTVKKRTMEDGGNEEADGNERKRSKTSDDKPSKAKGKSPLLRALKKQKEEKEKSADASSETKKRKKAHDEPPKKSVKGAIKDSSEKATKAKTSAKKTQSPRRQEKSESKDTAKPSAGKETVKGKKVKADEDEGGSDFIAAKKYKGSKNGYVFKNGKQGLGYYVDVKPVVDKMALEALIRHAEQMKSKKGRQSSSRSGKGNKRRGRR